MTPLKRFALVSATSFILFLTFSVNSSGCNATPVNDPAPSTGETQASQPKGDLVEFPGPDNKMLHGYLYKPEGSGPFPALLWNHGSEQLPGWQPELAQFYINKGFVFFIPHRSGQGKSANAGPYIGDRMKSCYVQPDKDGCIIRFHEQANLDVVAAYDWLKARSFVDANQIVMSGLSFGGIQTLLTAEKGLGIRCFVPFAPAAMSWDGVPGLHQRLLKAAKNAKPPIFLIQAKGDYNLGPSDLIGGYLKTKGGLNNAKIYPKFGRTEQDNHAGFAVKAKGIDIWGSDVIAFINAALVK